MSKYRYKYDEIDRLVEEQLYSNNYTTKTNEFYIGKSVVLLMFLSTSISAQELTSNIEITNNLYVNESPCLLNSRSVDINDFQLEVGRSMPYSRSNINYAHYLSQFESNIKSKSDRLLFTPLFNYLAHGLEHLKVEKSYIDISTTKKLMEFHLNLGKGIYVSILKGIDTVGDDIIEYTISVNNELRNANFMHLNELQDKLVYIQKTLGIL